MTENTYEELIKEVKQIIIILNLINKDRLKSFPNVNFSIVACECVGEMIDDPLYAKMFNREYRTKVVDFMFERACATAHALKND